MKREYFAFAFMGAVMALVLTIAMALPTNNYYRIAVFSKKTHTLVRFSPKEEVLVAAYRHGWLGKQWACLTHLIELENRGFNPAAKNPHSSATGIFQVITSPSGRVFRNYSLSDQAQLGTDYIATRYGTPCKALKFHLIHNFY